MPPYLAGRDTERLEFSNLLKQETILSNLILTGLRGVGKTVLLGTLRPLAQKKGWISIGTDLSESASISEDKIAIRLLTDLSMATAGTKLSDLAVRHCHGLTRRYVGQELSYEILSLAYAATPGLSADKLKSVLELSWACLKPTRIRGVVFSYDEAQNLSDHCAKEQFPLSLLLEIFQSIQRKGIPFMLVLTGLPTLLPKLIEARTYSERMFRVLFLGRLSERDSRAAILTPIQKALCPVKLNNYSVNTIVELSGGYPYFIQFVCREVYDLFIQKLNDGHEPRVPVFEILRKLDADFFWARWGKATDRQRQLLTIIALVLSEKDSPEFSVQEIVERSKDTSKPFSGSHVNQMLVSLGGGGLVYKDRHGRYLLAVPLLDQFIMRQIGQTLPVPYGPPYPPPEPDE